MTDQRLHDLLYESVADAAMPDLADTAWRSGVRTRHRRTAVALAGATAVVVAVAGGIGLTQHDSAAPGPVIAPQTTAPSSTVDHGPDAHFGGRPVWWAPILSEEGNLLAYPDSPLPATIDVTSVLGELVDHPLTRAVAAYAGYHRDGGLEAVEVLGADGGLRPVDTSPVKPMTDPEGHQRIDAGTSMLSPSGERLMFPQQHSILVLTLRTGAWRTIDTGTDPTWDATWVGDTSLLLPDSPQSTRPAPVYTLDGKRHGPSSVPGLDLPGELVGTSQPYGRVRLGGADRAQAYYPGSPIPQPPALGLSAGQSDWIAVSGQHDSVLLVPADAGRQKGCCQVDGWVAPDTLLYESDSADGQRLIAWQVGTHHFWLVATVAGITAGDEYEVSSYARLWAPG